MFINTGDQSKALICSCFSIGMMDLRSATHRVYQVPLVTKQHKKASSRVRRHRLVAEQKIEREIMKN